MHTSADLGKLGERVEQAKVARGGRQAAGQGTRAIERLWDEIEGALAGLALDYARVRVYQDGLPECGREMEIVRELAQSGSRNYRLLLELHARGAAIMGTEDAELLIAEFQAAAAALAAGGRRQDARDLLAERDRHIAARINATLAAGETGLLFLGMLHNIAPLLDGDIRVRYPARRPARGGAWR